MAAYLLRHLEKASSLINDGRLSLFLDYDGTLTGITGRPDEARLQVKTGELVKALASMFPLAIVSGRSLADIKARVGVSSIVYAGNHGLEISSPDFTMTYDVGLRAKAALDALRPKLSFFPGKFEGVIIEDKKLSLTVHYRLLDPQKFLSFKAAFDDAVGMHVADGAIRLTQSRKAFEIRAGVDWDKGRALEWILERPLFNGTSPLYVGDDDTDMDAYRSVGVSGISVNVGRAVDEALYFLKSQKEVAPFLKWLCRYRRAPHPLMSPAC